MAGQVPGLWSGGLLTLLLCAALIGCRNGQSGMNAAAPPAAPGGAPMYALVPLDLGGGGIGGGEAAGRPGHAAPAGGGAVPAPVGGPQARLETDARAINGAEQVVGSFVAAGDARRAFIWTAGGGLRDLNQLVKDKPAGMVLSEAVAISDTGAILARSNAGLVLLRPLARAAAPPGLAAGD